MNESAVQQNDWYFIDAGIRNAVKLLNESGVETFESCQGGDGHCFLEPTVRFHGGQYEGFRALSCALMYGLRVTNLRRYWVIIDGEPVGPKWEMTFRPDKPKPPEPPDPVPFIKP